jgi:hypothetical protein
MNDGDVYMKKDALCPPTLLYSIDTMFSLKGLEGKKRRQICEYELSFFGVEARKRMGIEILSLVNIFLI